MPSPEEAVQLQAATQQAVLTRIVEVLQADERVLGAWLSGSFGRGEDDAWADFDLQVAVEDGAFESFLSERRQLYARVGEAILVQPEFVTSDNLNMGGAAYQCVYFAGAVMVDWNIGPASKAHKPIGHKLLFEKQAFAVIDLPALTPEQRLAKLQWWTTFFWAMTPIAVKYCARGATRQAARQTDFLCRALICLHRLLAGDSVPDPWLEWANRPLEDGIDATLSRTGVEITPASTLSTIEELCSAMQSLHPQLDKLGIDVHPLMSAETSRLAAIAAEVAAKGVFPRRKYR